jgi:hypothetical protein
MAIIPGLNWTAPHDVFLGQITEVDMSSAGLTVIRQEGLLPAKVLARVEALPKSQQSVAVGKLSRLPEFKGLAGCVTEGIRKRVDAMLQQNDVGADRILSVKRDAVFVTGPAPGRLILQDGTRFKIKGSYTSFASLGGVEVYAVPRRGIADLKGIPDERRELHAKFITRMVLDVLGMIERNNLVEAADTLQQFRRDYAARLLPLGFYREFNSTSAYAVRAGDNVFHLDGESDVDRSAIEIAYNLKNVVVPLARAIA